MRKISILVTVLIFLWLLLFIFAYKKYQFNTDAVWKIEQQRREHKYFLPSISNFIHNKGVYFSYSVLENYLSYYSPSIFFYGNQPLILELITLVAFYIGFFILLRTNTKLSKIVLFWTLAYPLFIALVLQAPTFFLRLPLIIGPLGIFIQALFKKIRPIFINFPLKKTDRLLQREM